MLFSVYKITNIKNGFIYIGATTKQLEARLKNHNSVKHKVKDKFHKAITKYGIESFIIELLELCATKEEMFVKEFYWIKHLNSIDPLIGYNTYGGGGKIIKNPTEKDKIIGNKIKELLWSQKKLCRLTGISETKMSNYLNEHEDFTQSDLDKINKVLGTSFKLNN